MKFIKKYKLFETEDKGPQYDGIKKVLMEMIEKSLNTSDKKTLQDFIESLKRNPESSQIQGLINDSDVYEFYLKYRNEIDQILSEKEFYDKKPSELESFSLYDYLIVGTKEAIRHLIS
jgi:hypothetical protein